MRAEPFICPARLVREKDKRRACPPGSGRLQGGRAWPHVRLLPLMLPWGEVGGLCELLVPQVMGSTWPGYPTHGLTCARMYSVIHIAHTWTRADTHRRCSAPGPLLVAAMPVACCWRPCLASLALWAAFFLLRGFVLAASLGCLVLLFPFKPV